MCDKKNSVLFTENECLVLSSNFKLLDESQVLLKVPRKNNVYSFDMQNVVPSGGLTCLIMKATSNESNMWHKRLGVHVPLFDTMLVHDQPSQGEGPTLTVESQHTPSASPSTSQPTTSQPTSLQEQPSQVPITEPIPETTTSSLHLHETTILQTSPHMPHDSPLPRGHTPGSVEGSMSLNELMDLCTKLFDKVTSLENDLKQTKQLYGKAITKLVKKVKLLEDNLKSTKQRRETKMVISDDEEDLDIEDTFKQGRMKETEFEEVMFTEFTQGEEQSQDSFDAHLGVLSAAKILADASRERVKTYIRRRSNDSSRVSTAAGIFSTAEDVHDKEQFSNDEQIAQKLHDEEKARAATREEQERIDFEKALKLQRQLDEREDTDDIDWNAVVEQVQERESDIVKRYQTLKKKPKDTEVEKIKTKRVTEETLLQESFNKLRADEASRSKPVQEQQTEESQELSEEELQKLLVIVLVEEIYVEALQVKVGDHIEAYQTFAYMLKKFDRDNLEKLWTLVKERFNTTIPTNDKEKELWVELKRLFEPDDNDMLWKLQRYMHDPLIWKLYDTCGVHHVSSSRGHDIFMLVEKDYPLPRGLMTIMLANKLQVEEDREMARNLVMKIFTQANRPRSSSV
ncbi:hypothetical protein Tco_0408987 [Tanacetum coccineum]